MMSLMIGLKYLLFSLSVLRLDRVVAEHGHYGSGGFKTKIPTLENLFQKVTYWDINNNSSPCIYADYKRNYLCQKVVTFDRLGYEQSLQDTRKLLLSRLNLDQEPDIRMDKDTLNFINQLEENFRKNSDHSENSIVKTKFDMKSSQSKISNSMHEALS